MGKKRLAIAEKPSLARNIAKGISLDSGERFTNKDGYIESDNHIVTWAIGHLYELVDLEVYSDNFNPNEKTYWNLDDLPFSPEEYKFKFRPRSKKVDGVSKPEESIVKQLRIIKGLIDRDDVESIIHVGDAGREGTVIVSLILEQLGNTKPVDRLWSGVQTPEALVDAMKIMKPLSEYELDYAEGLTRMYMDWLEGINLTRYVTLRAGNMFNIGRVITPIVGVINQRREEIDNFVAETYFNLESAEETKGEVVKLVSAIDITDQNEANQKVIEYNNQQAVVSEVKRKQTEIKAPRLFSQTTLQNYMAKEYGFDPKSTLASAQVLYDNGYITYPRTGAQFLSKKEVESTRSIFNKLNDPELEFDENNLVFNDRALGDEADHTAIIPTGVVPKGLKDNEEKLYKAVLMRFRSNFLKEKCLVDRTNVTIKLGESEDFKLKGDILITEGWRKNEAVVTKEENLPDLSEGEVVNTKFAPVSKKTKSPSLYTVTGLNNFLENPFGQVIKTDGSDLTEEEMDMLAKASKEGLAIGTEATRAGIIDTAIRVGYISFKKGNYDIESKGILKMKFVNLLDINLTPKRTAEMERDLKKISRGELDPNDLLNSSMTELNRVMSVDVEKTQDKINDYYKKQGYLMTNYGLKKIIGKCHFCGSPILEGPKALSCSSSDCGLFVMLDNKFLKALGLKSTKTEVKTLLEKGQLHSDKMVSKKSGKNYAATIKASVDPENKRYLKYDLEFEQRKGAKK